MAENYYYMWEMVTSLTIIVLVTAYILHDRLKLRYTNLDEKTRSDKVERLNGIFQSILGVLALIGGNLWIYYILTHTIYISEELMGPNTFIPPILMGIIGLTVLVIGLKKRFSDNNLRDSKSIQ